MTSCLLPLNRIPPDNGKHVRQVIESELGGERDAIHQIARELFPAF
jgi:hypothetical protein